MFKCRLCKVMFKPSPSKLRSKDYICNPCANKRMASYKEKRLTSGNPVDFSKYAPRVAPKGYYKRDYVVQKAREKRAARHKNKDVNQRYVARQLVNYAIKTGNLIKQPCQVCGKERVEAHHCNYNKPLEVMWLCRKHHCEWHKQNKPIDLIINN